MDLWAVFLTGLFTGGLSCLAVQGGLLASAITRPVVVGTEQQKPARRKKHHRPVKSAQTGIQVSKDPLPVLYFLGAKLVAYTVLGALLGALGSALKITPAVQAVMMILAGVYMVITALNMLNVHPIFRYAVIQPPKALTRLVRNQAKSEQAFTPIVLGLMTVLIPCGTTLGMEATAIASVSPLWGALIMFAFVLGTIPTFFVLGFVATQLRGKVQTAFAMIAALLVLGIGFVTIDSGLVLADSPLAPRTVLASVLPDRSAPAPAMVVDGVQEITINALNNGYSPTVLVAQAGMPIRLNLDTNDTWSCARDFVIRSLNIQQVLPSSGRVTVDIPAQPAGQIRFSCSMGMYTGVIYVQ
jgi:uncharacterized protein